MLKLSPTRIETLAPELEPLLRQYRDRWMDLRLTAVPADRLAAEIGIEKAYVSAGLAPPKQIIWTGGPAELGRMRAGPKDRNVLSYLLNEPLRKISARLWTQVSDRLFAQINTRGQVGAIPFAARMASNALEGSLDEARSPLHALMRWLTRSWATDRDPTASQIWTQHDNEWLWPYDFMRDAYGLVRLLHPLDGLLTIAGSAGYIVPHETVCWAGERHDCVRRDAFGRLHASDGAALAYRDGWKAFYWKGVRIAPWMVERRDLITSAVINFERDPVMRRCLIGLLSAEQYIAAGSASKLSSDETGILWRRHWPGDTWSCVEVINGTPEADGSYKHYFLEVPPHIASAREAVAWTYGMSEHEYRHLVSRT